jgi:hypothetical protein
MKITNTNSADFRKIVSPKDTVIIDVDKYGFTYFSKDFDDKSQV